jgi:hypothetical protein
MYGNSPALVIGQSSSTNYVFLDFYPYSEKVMKVMVLAWIIIVEFEIFYQVCLDAK